MKVIALAAAAVAAGLAQSAQAANWPDQPITLIVPASPGGGTDAIARTIAPLLSKELGQPVNVINRTGGATAVGHVELINAKPDGYTIALGAAEFSSFYWTGVWDYTYKDVTPVALINFDASAFSVAENSPWKTLKEAIDAIKSAPSGTYKVTAPPGGAYHLALSTLLDKLGIDPRKLTVVPTQGAPPGLQELVSGGVQVAPFAFPEIKSMYELGYVRPLAIYAEQRLAVAPKIPIVKEALGIDFTGGTWRGIMAPKGLDPAITARLIDATDKAVHSEAFTGFMAKQGFGVGWIAGDKFGAFMAQQHEIVGNTLKALHMAQRAD